MIIISSMYPDGYVKKSTVSITAALIIIAADFFIIYFSQFGTELNIDRTAGVIKTKFSIIQLGVILLLMVINPVILLIRTAKLKMSRIRYSVLYFLSGIICSYILFIGIFYAGNIYGNRNLFTNPFLPISPVFMLITTSYLLLDIKNNDFIRFYKKVFINVLYFTTYTIPVYYFLRYAPQLGFSTYVDVIFKSAVIFTYIVISYRLINLLNSILMKRHLNRLIKDVNEIVVPVHELKKITDMEGFWSFITRENFQGLRKALGIQSAYFMLSNRKDNGYSYTYGYGPGLEPDFLSAESSIIKELSSYRSIFEKSYLLTDQKLQHARDEINEFFTNNNLEAAVSFRNMSDTITGFLFFGKIEKGGAYTADILEALELLRIKLQSLLITGLILDEVTADQVNDHDNIVVNTIKKRIMPDEMISIPGIRISSFNINNSSLGGDYIDAVRIGKDSSIIFIADTSYTGIESALSSLELYSILHSRTMTFNSAEKALNTMNQVLKTSNITNNHVKSSCVIISSDGNFTYSNASLNPMLIYDAEKGTLSEIETASIPLGIDMDYRYSLTSARLRENSIGILYSDGLFTSCNSSGDPYPFNRLKDIISRFSKQNPSIIIREIYRDFNGYTAGQNMTGDVSVIVFKKVKSSDD